MRREGGGGWGASNRQRVLIREWRLIQTHHRGKLASI